MEFKDQLYTIRKERGYSQEELASVCHVSIQNLINWENGRETPNVENLKTLADVLQVRFDTIMDKEDDKPQHSYIENKWTREYRSSLAVFGIALVHINVGFGKRADGKRHIAKGIIAIGNTSFGLISIGMMSVGVISLGILTLGLCLAIGALALSYVAIGALAIGYIAIGALAIGAYSIGALSIGYVVSIGALSYGTTAIGVSGRTWGESMYYLTTTTPNCFYRPQDIREVHELLQNGNLPFIIKEFIRQLL